MRNISFALTTPQVRARQKWVTRRLGRWWSTVLRKGDLLSACVKTQGIKAGELERICVIEVEDVRVETLRQISATDVVLEGFPDMNPYQFIVMFCEHMKCQQDQVVTRIEFRYVTRKCGYPWTACNSDKSHAEDCPMRDPRYGPVEVTSA